MSVAPGRQATGRTRTLPFQDIDKSPSPNLRSQPLALHRHPCTQQAPSPFLNRWAVLSSPFYVSLFFPFSSFLFPFWEDFTRELNVEAKCGVATGRSLLFSKNKKAPSMSARMRGLLTPALAFAAKSEDAPQFGGGMSGTPHESSTSPGQ